MQSQPLAKLKVLLLQLFPPNLAKGLILDILLPKFVNQSGIELSREYVLLNEESEATRSFTRILD